MKLLKGLILLSLLFTVACNSSDNSYVNIIKPTKFISYSNFKGKDTLLLNKVKNIEIDICTRMYIKNSELFYVNSSAKDYFVIVSDTNGVVINKSIRKGHGPNEVFSVHYLGFLNNLIYAYDGYTENVLYFFNDSDIINKKSPKAINTVEAGEGRLRINKIITLNMFIATSDTSRYKFKIIDSNFNVLKLIGKYNIKINENNNAYVNSFFAKRILLNPNKNKVALFYYNLDLFEIYDISGKLLNVVQGPDNFALHNFKPQNQKLDSRYVLDKERNYWAYENEVAKGEYIYALYNGNRVKENCFSNQKLFVFDWEGNPVKYFYLSKPISAFEIDEKTNTLYGYNTYKGILYKAKLDF